MICTCRSCHSAFWRYRRDWPPSGFCSLPCHDIGPQKSEPTDKPPLPAVVLAQMQGHRRQFHNTTSPLGWFDCRMCDELESDYAASLEYHYHQITTEIVKQAQHRWNEPRVRASEGATS